ncbi:hypothetical protein SAMN04488057_104163 [Cyclobacterium lianum]|uniref:Uncharacterized protein n=1 Tax=Cyclobacterium lianum TaxID=388280 RepID=A0A1M7M8S3_9BACT|nr:hypothetical protein [Cyclobacterium lianum]SHM87108.1 hypothetical protein SAMN04488057_104163 [Cyclobacterium lianum]
MNELDFSFSLFSEEGCLHEFIEGSRIQRISDFEKLSYNNCRIRYLNLEADLEVKQMKFDEAPLNFRLHKMKTLVFSASIRQTKTTFNPQTKHSQQIFVPSP